MRIIDIAKMPTVITKVSGNGMHESLLRSFQILEKTKELLVKGTPTKVVLMLIEEMETSSDDN